MASRVPSASVVNVLTLILIGFAPNVGVPRPLSAQQPATIDSSCRSTFDSMVADVSRNYPGYQEKVRGHRAAFAALSDSVRERARAATDWGTQCFPALRHWVEFFKDPHIAGPWQAAPPSPQPQASGAQAIQPPDSSQLPSLVTLDTSTLLLRLPDLDVTLKPTIDSLVAAHWDALRNTRYLIVDVRGDGGGCTCSYDTLMSLVIAGPVRSDGKDVLASPANEAYWRDWLTQGVLGASEEILIRKAIQRMRSHEGQLVELFPAQVLRPKSVSRLPQRVAVLVDRKCASSCEDFVLAARQSSKVTIMGSENTEGVHDYGNIRKVYLPGWRQMRVPTTRTRGPRIDLIGIKPDVLLPLGTDLVVSASHFLKSGKRNQAPQ